MPTRGIVLAMNKTLFTLLTLMVLSALGSSYYIFYYQKDYEFLVEASCDPSSQSCFARDCVNTDGCPPNNLSIYKVFELKASDFDSCKDTSCKMECESGTLSCVEVKCGDGPDDICVSHQK